jgi:hypothetical protein
MKRILTQAQCELVDVSTERELGAINFFNYMLLESMSICGLDHLPPGNVLHEVHWDVLFISSAPGRLLTNWNIWMMCSEAVSELCRKARYKCSVGEGQQGDVEQRGGGDGLCQAGSAKINMAHRLPHWESRAWRGVLKTAGEASTISSSACLLLDFLLNSHQDPHCRSNGGLPAPAPNNNHKI